MKRKSDDQHLRTKIVLNKIANAHIIRVMHNNYEQMKGACCFFIFFYIHAQITRENYVFKYRRFIYEDLF